LHKDRPNKAYSLTDCLSMQVMRQEGLTKVLTNDHHFTPATFSMRYSMKRLCLLVLVIGFFSACASPPFTPQTLEGARCKLDCIDRASVMLLGNSYGRCIEACMDIDRLYKARETTP